MIYASMLELVRNGNFGSIRSGMSRDELHELLGTPIVYGPKDNLDAIWRYGDIEFHFINDPNSVTFIYTDHNDLTDGGSTLKIDPWIIRRDLTRHEFEYNLRKLGVGFTYRNEQIRDRKEILTDSGVDFVFLEKSGKHLRESFLDGWTF